MANGFAARDHDQIANRDPLSANAQQVIAILRVKLNHHKSRVESEEWNHQH